MVFTDRYLVFSEYLFLIPQMRNSLVHVALMQSGNGSFLSLQKNGTRVNEAPTIKLKCSKRLASLQIFSLALLQQANYNLDRPIGNIMV